MIEKPRARRARNHMVNCWREPIHEWAVILAGGDGTRLRELSYEVSGDRRPKQFCEFFGGKTLFAHTPDRPPPLFLHNKTFLLINQGHRIYFPKELFEVRFGPKILT